MSGPAGPPTGGPVAVVTGAARGLGAATARRLAGAGWRVVLVDACAGDPAVPYALATREELETTVEECRRLAGDAAGVVGDVRAQADLDAAVAVAEGRFGGLDAAVAAAGVIAGGPAGWETQDATWDALVGVNLAGVWRLARATVPAILARPEPRAGRFVAISSVGALLGLPRLAAYCAAKAGVVGLVRALAAELGPAGVTANVVCPGSMGTAMLAATAPVYDLADPAEFAVHHALGRLLDPEEVARVVAFLCSPEASAMTGAVVPVDAGMTAT